jgi:predicted DNA binding protein
MYKAVFRIEGEGPCERATAETGATIELWCNDHCDLLHVTGDGDGAALARVEREVGITERIDADDHQVAITGSCLKPAQGDYVETYLAAHDCLALPPLRYEGGRKVVRVLALDPHNLTTFYRAVAADHAVDVESKQRLASVTTETPLVSIESVLPSLSARQREVFRTAHEQGYYEIPRGTTTAAVAGACGVERRTAEHHLRRAEQKLAGALIGYL